MMSCDKYKTLMMDSLFDEISAEDQKKLDDHLKSCPSCKEEFTEMQQTVKTLEKWPDENPAGRTEKRRNILPLFPGSSSKFKRNIIRIAAAAAVLLLCLSLANFRLSWSSGKFDISFSMFGSPERYTANDKTAQKSNLTHEDVRLIMDLISSQSRRQQSETAAVLTDFYKAMELKRQADMTAVAQGMRFIQDDTQQKLGSTNEVLTRLIQYSDSYRLEQGKTKSGER
jgi:predicted anti-sigma-YlaC factor YlaD